MIENLKLMADAKIAIFNKPLYDDLIKIFPLEDNQLCTGSLCNHFRGKIRLHGDIGLIERMCNNSLRKVIAFYS